MDVRAYPPIRYRNTRCADGVFLGTETIQPKDTLPSVAISIKNKLDNVSPRRRLPAAPRARVDARTGLSCSAEKTSPLRAHI